MHMKMQQDEKLLIELIKKGDKSAYEKLIIDYEGIIYSLCLRILKDDHEAYDAAQESCIKIWKQINSFKGESKFSTWVYRITVNQCLDILRKNRKKSSVLYINDDDKKEDNEPYEHNEWEDIGDKIVKNERNNVLKEAILELKEEYRIIIILRDVEEKSYEEISDILSLSLGTVKSRISRARQSLKKILQQDKEPYRSFFRHNN